MNTNPQNAINAFGAMGEATLTMYRAAVNAGASAEEAKNIVEAYFSAVLKSGHEKLQKDIK